MGKRESKVSNMHNYNLSYSWYSIVGIILNGVNIIKQMILYNIIMDLKLCGITIYDVSHLASQDAHSFDKFYLASAMIFL
jgi:hypothetical protein